MPGWFAIYATINVSFHPDEELVAILVIVQTLFMIILKPRIVVAGAWFLLDLRLFV
nr:hypothetical protein [Candidatus Sigynarchaeota archaeon]